jgi:hypothetical protein
MKNNYLLSPVLVCFGLLLLITQVIAQEQLSQTIRGTIFDHVSQIPLPGATVFVIGSDPVIGTATDADGNFRLTKVPVGTQNLKVSFIGYKELSIPNIIVNSGKEVVLNIPLEEEIVKMQELVIRANEKDKPLNEMATVSARTFSVEETIKFAAAVNDPARMVSSFAGVVQSDDGSNNISIRGNSPNGLLWRLEGVDIPNPNHFAAAGSAGGGIMILSSQLLANSDFLTGAFPAEYGNALSGAFDLRLRKGNNERKEFTAQAGFLGLDVAAEGPLRNGKGSYLINYRYSTLSIISNLGVDLGGAVTDFQDISFNIHMPTEKAGSFSIFGFGGLSGQNFTAEKDSSLWENEWDRYSWNYVSNTGAVGFKHGIILNKNAHLQTIIMASGNEMGTTETKLDEEYQSHFNYENKFIQRKLTFNSVLNQKINSRLNMRSGFYVNLLNYGLKLRHLNEDDVPFEYINDTGNTQSVQAFTQWNYQFSEKWSAVAGLHYHRLMLNGSSSLEPRASVQYQFKDVQAVSFGYGLHSQVQPLGTYFAKPEDYTALDLPNKNLELSKSHHYVLAYDHSLNRYLRVKVETYYQSLFDIPVSADPDKNFSMLNNQWGFPTQYLVSEGEGRNYGLEFTLEHFMHNDLYFLLSTSFYESHFKGRDGNWYNTRFNGNYSSAFTAGKEFPMQKNRSLGFNLRTILMGGLRESPIDFAQSIEKGNTVYIETEAYSQQLPDYFRPDIRISLKRNRPQATHTLALDVQNVINRKNVFGRFYDIKTESIKTHYQTPMIPLLSYKVEFH